MIFHKKDGLKKIIGLRKDVTNGKEWKYLLFYDVDSPSEADIEILRDNFEEFGISYIIYRTKNGVHTVGLQPLDILDYSWMFDNLHKEIPEYYSGMIIRLSLKENENQELLYYNLDYPLMSNLFSIYQKRFKELQFESHEDYHADAIQHGAWINGWKLVFEKYWSRKQ